MPVSEEFRGGCPNSFNYKQRYKNLKRKFRYLIYENECFQEELKKAHRRLLKVNQDKSFLLDRLLQYEKIDDTSSDSDGTISSDSDLDNFSLKKKRSNASNFSNSHGFSGLQPQTNANRHSVSEPSTKRKKPASKSTKSSANAVGVSAVNNSSSSNGNVMTPAVTAPVIKVEPEDSVPLGQGDGHMTSEEIERHLESRQTLLDLVPERAPPTVPTEMFSSDMICIDRYLND